MKRFLSFILAVGVIALSGMTGQVFAGEKANVVVTTSANQVIAMGVRAVTGSSTFSISGIGTVTAVIPGLTVISDDIRYVMGTSSGANVTLKVYGVGAGTATALSTTATVVEYLAIGTP